MVETDRFLGAFGKRPGATTPEPGCLTSQPMSAYDTRAEGRTDSEHATVVESDPRWKGPFIEYDRYGEPTGAEYVRCSGCGVEVLAGDTRHATHRDGCDGDRIRGFNEA